MTGAQEPVDVTVMVKPLDGSENTATSTTPDTIYLSPTRGADWLHLVMVEIRPDRVIAVVVPKDPHTPINRLTVRPDGSATFTT